MRPELPVLDWFRPPTRIEMMPLGDRRRFLLVCEPVLGSIFGVGYEITNTAVVYARDAFLVDKVHAAAEAELDRRIAADETAPEGSDFERFLWAPTVTTLEDGTVEVK